MSRATRTRREYRCRPFVPDDVHATLELYQDVWGRDRTPEWFRWRFLENPYVDRVPMVVAERDGRIVGAAPCLAFPLRAGSRERFALQPADWMVHPDHRRQGLSSSMTGELLELDVGAPVDLYFNFPTSALLNGLRKFGWRSAGPVETRYRIQRPGALVSPDGSGGGRSSIGARLSRLSSPLLRGYLRVRTPRRRNDPALIAGRHDSVPVDLLLELASRDDPDGIHVPREEAYLRWRFANPRWETTTYVVRRRGDPVAAAVACTETRGGVVSTSILDVLPRGRGVDVATNRALLRPLVEDASGSAVVKAAGDPLPASVLDEFGFLSDVRFPFSSLSTSTRLAVRPGPDPDDARGVFGGIDPAEAGRWSLPLADQDVA